MNSKSKAATPVEKTQILVVGGGPVGLCAALCAARRGLEVTLLETTSPLGLSSRRRAGSQRTWLAGDAAHVTSPFGGQSMNGGLLEGTFSTCFVSSA